MALTELSLPPEIWAATPAAAQALILYAALSVNSLQKNSILSPASRSEAVAQAERAGLLGSH